MNVILDHKIKQGNPKLALARNLILSPNSNSDSGVNNQENLCRSYELCQTKL